LGPDKEEPIERPTLRPYKGKHPQNQADRNALKARKRWIQHGARWYGGSKKEMDGPLKSSYINSTMKSRGDFGFLADDPNDCLSPQEWIYEGELKALDEKNIDYFENI